MLKRSGALITFGLSLVASPASSADTSANTSCESREAILDFLSSKYAEAPVEMEVSKDGVVVEILTTGSGSTFTIIVTTPNCMTCMAAAGDSWKNLVPARQRI